MRSASFASGRRRRIMIELRKFASNCFSSTADFSVSGALKELK